MLSCVQLSFATAANILIACGIGVAVEDAVAVAYACIAAFGWSCQSSYLMRVLLSPALSMRMGNRSDTREATSRPPASEA